MLQEAAIEAARKTVAESRQYVQPVPTVQKSINHDPGRPRVLIEKAVTNAIVKQIELQNSTAGKETETPETVTPVAPAPAVPDVRRAVGGMNLSTSLQHRR